jgi:hypothetical protein
MIVEPLQRIVTTAFPGAQLGMANGPVAAVESRLNLVLPEPLKDFFSVVGGSRDVLNADYRILPPEKLRLDADHLIFCEENQGLEDFAISLESLRAARPDPQVNIRPMHARSWTVEAPALSAFMLGMTAWQVLLALPEKARCPFPQDELNKLLALFEPVGTPQAPFAGPRFGLVDRRSSIVAAYEYTSGMLYVGSPLEDVLEEWEQKAGLDLESL